LKELLLENYIEEGDTDTISDDESMLSVKLVMSSSIVNARLLFLHADGMYFVGFSVLDIESFKRA
jgi:hypothetical protein